MSQDEDVNSRIVYWVARLVRTNPTCQIDCRTTAQQALYQANNFQVNLRVRISSARYGVEAPAECDFLAAVQRVEDGEVLRYDRCAGSLCSGLLRDQICFVRDGRHAGCRARLNW